MAALLSATALDPLAPAASSSTTAFRAVEAHFKRRTDPTASRKRKTPYRPSLDDVWDPLSLLEPLPKSAGGAWGPAGRELRTVEVTRAGQQRRWSFPDLPGWSSSSLCRYRLLTEWLVLVRRRHRHSTSPPLRRLAERPGPLLPVQLHSVPKQDQPRHPLRASDPFALASRDRDAGGARPDRRLATSPRRPFSSLRRRTERQEDSRKRYGRRRDQEGRDEGVSAARALQGPQGVASCEARP